MVCTASMLFSLVRVAALLSFVLPLSETAIWACSAPPSMPHHSNTARHDKLCIPPVGNLRGI